MAAPEWYIRRCLELGAQGAGSVAPNPMVGSVLVYRGTIVGEGYHRVYGQAHAEVNCIADAERRFVSGRFPGLDSPAALLRGSTLYVSLEPCAHHGKTPPCADLIIAKGIPEVVVGVRDPYPEVDGKGLEKLRAAGVHVTAPLLEEDCRYMNRRFFTFHTKRRPYVILKWAQSLDGRIGLSEGRTVISNPFSHILSHRWRSEEASILVGANTAMIDDPALTTRLWPGPNAMRLVLDPRLRLPRHLKVFDGSAPTVVFNSIRSGEEDGLQFVRVDDVVPGILNALYHMNVQSVLVEGGARLLQSFLDAGLWDEARVFTNTGLRLGPGVEAPVLPGARCIATGWLEEDRLDFYRM